MLKQMFLAHFQPEVKRFRPWEIPKCLEKGPFWDQKSIKIGSKTNFFKSDCRPFGVHKHLFLAFYEPVSTQLSLFRRMLCTKLYLSHVPHGAGT